jgi:hypothetical protein
MLTGGPGLGGSLEDGDSLFGSEIQKSLTTSESLVEDGVPPGSDDLDVGLKGVESEFETNLIVTLSGAPVRDVLAVFGNDDVHHRSGDDRSGERGTEKVDTLSRIAERLLVCTCSKESERD